MFIVSFPSGAWQANCYIIASENSDISPRPAIVIDPGMDSKATLDSYCKEHDLVLEAVIATHGHVDHIADGAAIANERSIPFYLHRDDHFMLTEPARGLGEGSEDLIRNLLGTTTLPMPHDLRCIEDGLTISHAGVEFSAVHCPGHSPGSVVLIGTHQSKQVVLSGDVLFASSVGRVDLPGGDARQMISSLRKLDEILADDAAILPGHGASTVMEIERHMNPFLKEALGSVSS